jgi:hypothetical protein
MDEHARVRLWLSPQEVGIMTGFSAIFIRREIQAKALPAAFVPSRAGKCGRYKIHRDDAIAYAIRLGVWRGAHAS